MTARRHVHRRGARGSQRLVKSLTLICNWPLLRVATPTPTLLLLLIRQGSDLLLIPRRRHPT